MVKVIVLKGRFFNESTPDGRQSTPKYPFYLFFKNLQVNLGGLLSIVKDENPWTLTHSRIDP